MSAQAGKPTRVAGHPDLAGAEAAMQRAARRARARAARVAGAGPAQSAARRDGAGGIDAGGSSPEGRPLGPISQAPPPGTPATGTFHGSVDAIGTTPPPTVLPAATAEEGRTVVDALGTLRQAGLNGSAAHLRAAAERINAGDWAGSVRESIHAVESVARQLDPEAAQTLGPALDSLEKRGALHPALKVAFSTLYGYTSDEQGIRHALLDRTDAQVGRDEAVFMLGACASFASYLWRKHAAGAPG